MSGEKRATLQDRVPQARIYKVWNIPGYNTRDFTLLQLVADVLARGQEQPPVQAPRLHRSDGDSGERRYRPVRDRLAIPDHRHREAGRRPAVVEKALDEEMARFLTSGPDPGRARAHQDHRLRLLRARRRAHRRRGRQGRDTRARASSTAAPRTSTRQSLRWLRDATPAEVQNAARAWLSDGVFVLDVEPFPEYHAGGRPGRPRASCPGRGTPPPSHYRRSAARHTLQRPEGRPRRAARGTGRAAQPDRRCGSRRRQSRQARAPPTWRWR